MVPVTNLAAFHCPNSEAPPICLKLSNGRRFGAGELQEGIRWLFREVYSAREYTRRKRHYMETVKQRL